MLCLALVGCAGGSRRQGPDFTVLSSEPIIVNGPMVSNAPGTNALPPATNISKSKPSQEPAAAAFHFADTWISLDQWSETNGFGRPRRVAGYIPPAYTVPTTNGTLFLRIGGQNASWDGLDFLLGFSPQIIAGHPFVHALDVRKNFDPFLNPSPAMMKSNLVIVLDPGHGGTDVGAQSVFNGHYEKEYTLDLAHRLQPLLATNGWTVLLTRISDYNVPLSNRVSFAEHCKADLFLSLHFNSAAPDHEQAGLETYCLTPAGMPSNLTRGFHDNAALTFPNNNFDTQNLQYAVFVHRAVLKINGHLDRGIRRARFLGVLQGQNRPAILMEGGYLSNPAEARRIADPAYRQQMAEALAGALEEYAGVETNLTSRQLPALPATAPVPTAAAAPPIGIKTN
jgi:N-acetylmuramoyl-L-alanine amidase